MEPEISIVIEGYNETSEIGCLEDTLASLRLQEFPLDRVELLLVGSAVQTADWERYARDPAPFASIKLVEANGAHYYQLKNLGTERSRGGILAFLDSDVVVSRHWLTRLAEAIEAGAEASCGPSLYQSGNAGFSGSPARQVAASISWSFIAPSHGVPQGFLSHNLGIRRDVFDRLRYRTDLGRTCAGSFLYQAMREAGVKLVFTPEQRVAHAFQWRWWVTRLHVRFGHEMYLLHRMEPTSVSPRARWLGPLDAVATPAWHVLLDFPKWWRYSGILQLSLARRVAGMVLVLPLALLARGAEAYGMLATMVAPEQMRLFAARN